MHFLRAAFRPLLLLLALACAHWVGKDHAGKGKGEEVTRPTPPVPVLPCSLCPECPPAPRPPPPRAACQNLPPPVVPEVAWAPPGCPVRKFGGCLTPADFAAHIRFLRAFETWRERCAK
jgi:hypothetical protein